MDRTFVKCFLGFAFAGLMLSMSSVAVRAQSTAEESLLNVTTQYDGESCREAALPQTIGFIASPSPSCYQPDRMENDCFINFYNLSVTTDQYMKSLIVKINNRIVANYQGFFQQSINIPYSMNGNGFKVNCGKPGAGGNPEMGKAYKIEIQAEDTEGLKSNNYATVYCPPYLP